MNLQTSLRHALLAAALVGAGVAGFAQPPGPPPMASQSASHAAAAPADVKPGVWEMSTVVDDPANHSQRSATSRTCVLPAEASLPQRLVPVQREPGMPCDNHDARRDGSAITWTIACKSPTATASGSGKLVVSALGYVGRAELEVKKAGAKPVKVKETFTGKWLEACK